MNDLSLHILDIAENSINAGANNIEIIVDENIENDKLILEINDDGKGMDRDTLTKLTDPFFTSRKTRKVGLGIPLLLESANEADGSLTVNSEPGKGTKVWAVLKYSHIDRKPLGDMAETLISLMLLSDKTELFYRHIKNSNVFEFNTKDLKRQLNIGTLKEVNILKGIKNIISKKLSEL